MKLGFQYGTKYIDFNVVFKERKTMSIEVEPSGEVNVSSPLGVTEDIILDKVKSKANWIVQKQYEVQSININKINREVVSGESYLYLGRNYSLQIEDINTKDINVKLFRGKFIISTYTRNQDKIKLALENWYREKTLLRVNERVNYYKQYFNIRPKDIKVKEQKKRWASCTSNNELLFNWRCSMAPANILDYIVLHEMTHMIYKDHSQEFWDRMAAVMPDYEVRKEWLRNNGIKLDI
ncbi:M48 family metallopeptidase [Clostridium paraputrificum]|uniref:M48 family metallopeptidase n=1 Tax=Clostridium paraputrificum TaxID=29363 RepID=UPI0018A08ED3|nr:SprT family zinc-dependent metalloprotease [Clostridium paraputrificum]MDB2092530.1 SprT family zinc-dependent metalloprotease [Clostridium paraputrificum]